jgi:NitT/TauT family transport system substrate-binding protein
MHRIMLRSPLKRPAVIAGALLCALTAFIGAARPASADDTLSIVTGAPTTGLFDLIEDVAAGAGFYKAEHLNIVKEYSSGAGTAAQLAASGKADMCVLSFDPVLIGYEKGLKLQAFLSRQSRYSYMLAVLDDSPVRTLSDLKGKTVGEPTFGGSTEALVRSILGGAGLKPTDYDITAIGYAGANLAAVTGHKVDATVDIFSNLMTNEAQAHVKYRIFRDPILDSIPNVGWAALPSVLAAKNDAFKRFSRAIVEASVFVRADPQAAAKIYLAAQNKPYTPEQLAATTHIVELLESELPASDPNNRRIGLVSPRNFSLYSRTLVQYGFMKNPVPGSDLATDQFIAYANDFDRKAVQALAHKMH